MNGRRRYSFIALKLLFLICGAGFALMPCAATEGAAQTGWHSAAGLWFDIAPFVELTNRPALSTSDTVSPDDLAWFYGRPAFGSIGFQLRSGPLAAVMSVELQQDTGELLLGGSLTNFLVSHDWQSFYFSNNYPSVGFVEGRAKGWHFSLGRRAINVGPGDYSLTVSDRNPWYDHAIAGLDAALGKGFLAYDFLAINTQNRASSGYNGKFLFMHRLQADFPRWAIGISEYNLVTHTPLDFQDIGPFLVYHHLFADGSNVMVQLDAEVRPFDNLRFYGEALMDDFRLGGENSSSNPDAFGFHAGLEWALLPSADYARPRFYRKDYSMSIGPSHLEGRLVASLEWYLCSTYLYRRKSSYENEAYFTRYFLQTQNLGWPEVESWFAYPLGPDRMLFAARLSYAKARLAASLRGSFTILGAESSETTFDSSSYDNNWLGPQTPWNYVLHTDISADYMLTRSTTLRPSAAVDWEVGEDPVFSVSFGLVQRLGVGTTD